MSKRKFINLKFSGFLYSYFFYFVTYQDDTVSAAPGTSSHQMGVRSNVLNRVGHQQDKWKRQVREQRRNIYDRHTMLN